MQLKVEDGGKEITNCCEKGQIKQNSLELEQEKDELKSFQMSFNVSS